MAVIEIDNLLDILQQKENDITVNDDTKEIIKILSAIKISKQQILRSYAQLSELPNPSLINKGNIYYVEAENGLYVSTGAAWLKIEFTSLASFNVTSCLPNGNGNLSYDNTTGEFAFTPPDLSSYAVTGALNDFICLTDLSICTNSASGNGNLSYDNITGEFAFTPPDLSSIDVTNAICDFICLTDLSICTNSASGNGNLSYDNITGEFAFTPPDLSSIDVTNAICDFICLTDLTIISGAPSSNGGLTYDNTTGEFIFNPADLSNKLELLDLSVCTNTASGNGGLTYDNTTGEFSFTPADLSSYAVTGDLSNFICLTDLSICTNSASGNGGLTYNNTTGEFAFTPADLSSIDVTNAICDFICLTDLSICTNSASGNGNLSYDNTTGEFSFTPADIDSYFTNGNICNLYITGTLCGPSTLTIDPAAHGDNTGTVVIAGNLQVDGVTTTVNSCTLEVADKNIVLACGSANAAASDGAGITADLGSDGTATLTYSSSNDRWEMNKSLATSVIGNVTGQVSDISNHSTTDLAEGTNLYYTDTRVDARLASGSLGDVTIGGTVTADQYNNNEVRHSIRPSLLLDFANSKRLDPRIAFTRSSTATYYDGKTFAKAEENLLTYSQEFDNWTKSNVTVTEDAATAPDTTTTADLLTANGSSSIGHGLTKAFAEPSSAVTISIYAKAGTQSVLQILFYGPAASVWQNYDLSTGSLGSGGSSSSYQLGQSITDVGNGWYRCVLTVDLSVQNSSNLVFSIKNSTTSARAATETNSGTIYVWGAQAEQRSSVTSYTPTTGTPITNYIPALQTAASGAARFDYDSITGESKGLLIEEQRTNLVTYSEDFANAAWLKTRSSITANTIVAPDGTLTGDKLVEDTQSGAHYVYRAAVSYTAGTSYTSSLYVKAGERSRFAMYLPGVAFSGLNLTAVFDLSLGTVISVVSPGIASIKSVGNGWYRCSVSAQATTTTTGNTVICNLYYSSNQDAYTGDDYSGIYIWGAQLEEGAFPTSYIKTTSAQVTRNSDSASMTGTNFSSWYNPSAGSIYAEATTGMYYSGVNEFPRIAEINAGGNTNNAFRLVFGVLSTETDFRTTVAVNGVSQYTTESGPANGVKQILAYKVDDFSSASNGNLLATDTSGVLPTVDTLFLGGYFTANLVGALNGHIKKFAYYPKRLTNAELQTLTET